MIQINDGENILTTIGTDECILDQLQNHLIDLGAITEKLLDYPDAQGRLLLFRYCFCSKPVHLYRTIRPDLLKNFSIDFENLKRRIINSLIKCDVTEAAYNLMTLRTSCGGIGIHDSKEVIPCAYASSLYNFIRNSDFKSYIFPTYLNINPAEHLKIFSSLLAQFSLIQLIKPPDPGEHFDFTVTFRLIDAIAKKLKRGETIQNVFHYIITKRRLEETETRLKNDTNNETKKESQAKYVWIKSLQAKEGSLFLSTIPKCKEYKITSDQLMIILRFRYLILLYIIYILKPEYDRA